MDCKEISKDSIYNSPYYLESLSLSKYILENLEGKNEPLYKLWSHCNHHLVTCIKMTYPWLKNYLEIGTAYGHSFCSVVYSGYYPKHKFMCIDLFDQFPRLNRKGGFYNLVRRNVGSFSNGNDCKLIMGNSQDENVYNLIKAQMGSIDLLFIDGDHSYSGVINDFKKYYPLVSKMGVIIFDDYLPRTRKSYKAINHLVGEYKDELNIIGILEDRCECNKVKPANYIKNTSNTVQNMSFIIQKIC